MNYLFAIILNLTFLSVHDKDRNFICSQDYGNGIDWSDSCLKECDFPNWDQIHNCLKKEVINRNIKLYVEEWQNGQKK